MILWSYGQTPEKPTYTPGLPLLFPNWGYRVSFGTSACSLLSGVDEEGEEDGDVEKVLCRRLEVSQPERQFAFETFGRSYEARKLEAMEYRPLPQIFLGPTPQSPLGYKVRIFVIVLTQY